MIIDPTTLTHAAQVGESFFGSCSPFFISGAVSSMLFGELARKKQFETTEEGLAFKEHHLQLQREFEDKKFNEELRSKRELLELGRFYQQIESKKNFDNDKKIIEFREFQSYWPLEIDIQAIWNQDIYSINNRQLTVILSRSNSIAKRLNAQLEYSNMCESLSKYADEVHNVRMKGAIWKDAANNIGGIAQNMNMHYIMQGIPTLVITPQLLNEKLHFDASIWSYGLGLGSFCNRSMLSMDYNDTDFDKLKAKIKLAQLAVMGLVRDNFMRIEFQCPATLPDVIVKEKALEQCPDIKQFLVEGYLDLEKTVMATPKYKELCSNREIDDMQTNILQSIKKLNA
ncbi:hypothetical protein FACS189434_10920 [Bacteroidia bacterium]|nr:hypothetical protein FACS189434_10920 [Bacteroidia bacterium]